jgi:hypothetical protein
VYIQIETAQSVEEADAIAAIDGVDGLFVGPADLSQNLGVVGEMMHVSRRARQGFRGVQEARQNLGRGLVGQSACADVGRQRLPHDFALLRHPHSAGWPGIDQKGICERESAMIADGRSGSANEGCVSRQSCKHAY